MHKMIVARKFMVLNFIILLLCVSTGCSGKINTPKQVTETTQVLTVESSEARTEVTSDNVSATSSEVEAAVSTHINQDLLEAHLKAWKLGNNLIFYAGSNRSYDWYIDQAHTGKHASSNCGPTSVAMASKWADASFEGTPEESRKKFRPDGGWWYNEDIENSLKSLNVAYDSVSIDDAYTLRGIIDSGRIAIINNSMGYITRETDENAHTNRFYSFDSGHYLILKGYVLVDQTTYFEVYDPNNWDMAYEDGTPMGKDRYYEASVFMASIENWYPYAIVIKPKE